MIRSEVRRGFFQELRLQPQFTVFPLQFAQPGSFTDRQRRLVVRVPLPIGGDPITQCCFIDGQFPRDFRDRRDVSITNLTASSLNSGENFLRC
jgi:hypothetical protein